MAAALLTDEPCVLRHVPDLSDVRFMMRILESVGASVRFEHGSLFIHAQHIKGYGDYDLVRRMRGSITIMGPLLGRLRDAKVALPGGCAIGVRPIDLHLKGFRALGAKLDISGGYVHATAERLTGTEIFLGGRVGPTVLGTANVLMAAVLAEGITLIDSAACEPEVVDVANFLTAMGAKISGIGSPTLTITGVKGLHGVDYEIIPDRIEAASYAIAAAATNGDVTLLGARPEHFRAVIDKLREAGVVPAPSELERRVLHAREPEAVLALLQTLERGLSGEARTASLGRLLASGREFVVDTGVFEARWTIGRWAADALVRQGGEHAVAALVGALGRPGVDTAAVVEALQSLTGADPVPAGTADAGAAWKDWWARHRKLEPVPWYQEALRTEHGVPDAAGLVDVLWQADRRWRAAATLLRLSLGRAARPANDAVEPLPPA